MGTREPLRAIVERWNLIYGLAMLHGTIAYAAYRAGRASSIAFVGEGDSIRAGSTTEWTIMTMSDILAKAV